MATLGELVVSLSANTAQFTGAMDKAAYLSKQRMDDMMKSANQLGAAIGAALVGGAVTFAAAMKSVVDGADELGKAAQKIGVTTEALSELQYAAELSGLNAESFQCAMSKLNRSIADGNPAFEAMGINVKTAGGELKTADVVIKELSEKFAGYKDGAEKSALAMELMGKKGAEMVPFLNSGAEGLKQMAEEARALGLVISKDVTSQAEAFNDNLTRIGKTQSGLVIQMTSALLPTMQRASEEFLALAKNTDLVSVPAAAAKTLFQTLAVVGSDVAFVFKMTGQEIGGIAAQLASLATLDFKGASLIGDMMKADAAKARTELDAFQARIMNIGAAGEAEGKKAETTGGIAAPIVAAAAKATKAAKDIKKSAEEALAAQLTKEGQRVFEQTRLPMEQLNEEYTRLNKLLEAGAINWDTYARAVFDAQEKLDPMAESTKEIVEKIEKVAKETSSVEMAITNSFGRMGDAVADFAMGGKTSFSDVINSMVRDLIRLQTQTMMTDLWKSVGGLSGIVGSLFGSSDSAGLSGARASGGPVSSGGTYLVGENGPELLSMGGSSGHVTANNQIGGSTTVVNVIESPGNGGKTEQRQQGGVSIVDVFVEQVKRSIAGDISDGRGAVPAAMSNAYGLNRAAGAY
jgi:hypothetical protein